MEQTSIHCETIPWMSRLATRTIAPMAKQAFARSRWKNSCNVAIGASKKLMSEVRPPNSTATKNTAMMRGPPGIVENRLGR